MGLHGIGLRTPHFPRALSTGLGVPLVEAITENFAGRGGRPLAVLEAVRRDAAVALHGVSLDLGGMGPLSKTLLEATAELAERVSACWVSEHLCFTTVNGRSSYDLWPLPRTEETLRHVVPRITAAQDALRRRLVLENVSSYVEHDGAEMSEWVFFSELVRRADCELLVDVNNIAVSAFNLGFDPVEYVRGLPSGRLRQVHLAGYRDFGTWRFDTHGEPVHADVWALYREFVRVHGSVPTIIEWDEDVPALERLLAECAHVEQVEREAMSR